MAFSDSAIRIIAVIFVIRFLVVEASYGRSSRRGQAHIFRPVVGLRLLFGVTIPGLLFGASQLVGSGDRWDSLLGLVVGIGGAATLFVMWPGTIIVDRDSIRETKWFGLRKVRIPWSDAAFAGGDIDNTVVVRSNKNCVIRHTQYHVDRVGFIDLLKQFCEHSTYNRPGPKPWVPLSAS
jgi:hypothetical protein